MYLGGGFNLLFFFTPTWGEMIQFDNHIFHRGLNHQLGMFWLTSDNSIQVIAQVVFTLEIQGVGPSV